MIVFDLECAGQGHRFEGWFGSSQDFAEQQTRGLVSCPQCGSSEVFKALMAPNVGRKGNQIAVASPSPKAGRGQAIAGHAIAPEAQQMMEKLATFQAKALEKSRWVGSSFAEESRAQHYGEREAEIIHGQATPEQAQDLLEEGIAVMPLPFPVAPPDQTN